MATQGIYLQITTATGNDDPDIDETASLTLIPTPTGDNRNGHASAEGAPNVEIESLASVVFNAISTCSSLHPDPVSPSSTDEQEPQLRFDGDAPFEGIENGMPPPMPGSGGWITAENVDQFFDENGDWRECTVGPNIGSVRTREPEETYGDDEDGGSREEAKRPRTG